MNKEPNELSEILSLRSKGPYLKKDVIDLKDKLRGAIIGRFAGCILGIPVENWSVERMLAYKDECHMDWPPTTYWKKIEKPDCPHYGVGLREKITEGKMDSVPADDDIVYTLLNMLALEKYGFSYTVDDMAKHWVECLPYACTAEADALNALRRGVEPLHAADGGEFIEWIGAAIRADAFAYAMAGDPEGAAKLSYNDAYLSHRGNGIYGEMFCAASIAAAFITPTPLDAIKEGMKQIPAESELYKALKWALSYEGKLKDHVMARALIDEKFSSMHCVHTINNMVALTFGIMLGGTDFTKAISNTIAIGLDNDCTGATVGSIVGANVGFKNIDKYWYSKFNDRIYSYIINYPEFSIEDVVRRFYKLATR